MFHVSFRMLRRGETLAILFLVISATTLSSIIPTVFGETESLSIPARSYEDFGIYLNQGDVLKYSIGVSGGNNDDINLIINIPGIDHTHIHTDIQHTHNKHT